MVPQATDSVCQLDLVGRDCAALAGGHDLARMEREAGECPEAAARLAAVLGSQGARRVFEDLDSRRSVAEVGPIERSSEQMHRKNGARVRRKGARHSLDVEVHRRGVDVDEPRPRARQRDDVCRGRKGVGGHEHLVTRADAERKQRQVQRRRTGRDSDGMLGADRPSKLVLELADPRSHREHPVVEHPCDAA